jgi:hypothetical protein
MTSSDENAGLALLRSWKNTVQLIQLHGVTNTGAVTFRSAGNIVELPTGSLHFVGPNCEVFVGFDGASFEVEMAQGRTALPE